MPGHPEPLPDDPQVGLYRARGDHQTLSDLRGGLPHRKKLEHLSLTARQPRTIHPRCSDDHAKRLGTHNRPALQQLPHGSHRLSPRRAGRDHRKHSTPHQGRVPLGSIDRRQHEHPRLRRPRANLTEKTRRPDLIRRHDHPSRHLTHRCQERRPAHARGGDPPLALLIVEPRHQPFRECRERRRHNDPAGIPILVAIRVRVVVGVCLRRHRELAALERHRLARNLSKPRRRTKLNEPRRGARCTGRNPRGCGRLTGHTRRWSSGHRRPFSCVESQMPARAPPASHLDTAHPTVPERPITTEPAGTARGPCVHSRRSGQHRTKAQPLSW